MRKFQSLGITLFLSMAGAAWATPVDLITLNTSSISGTTGSIDFQFNPGPGALAASIEIVDFTGASYIAASQSDTGAVTGGPVPTPLFFSNTDADNEDFEDVTFGASISFEVIFSGPAINSPTGTSGETTFYFSTFSDLAGTVPVLTPNPAGIDAEITITPEGTLSPTIFSPDVTVTAVPEPGAMGLLGAGLLGLGAIKRRFR